MIKTIYSQSADHSILVERSDSFHRYMRRIGAESVGSDVANAGKDYVHTYHVVPHGITLRYARSEEGHVSVTLHGKERAVSSLEKKILDEIAFSKRITCSIRSARPEVVDRLARKLLRSPPQ